MAAAAQVDHPEYVVVSWTTLQIPLSKTIDQRSTMDKKDFLALMSCHTPDKVPGFLRALYGRVKEDPETVWYLTVWSTHGAVDLFEATTAYADQRQALSKLSTAPLETHRCHINAHFWTYLKVDHAGIIDAYFPASISDADRQKAMRARGMVYYMARKPSAYYVRGHRGWVQGTQKFEGKEANVLRFLNYWRSAQSESEFKETEALGLANGRVVGVYTYFKEQLNDAGMMGMRELHCKFIDTPFCFFNGRPPPESDEDSEEYEKEIAAAV
ncbi:hypothetical protein CC80DRAFT_434159 [Byssothecium circinans]|uniref:ABM domain-containing protein n=1 Tax=Byssothecium circinans TaxID=147558 RepID=A0A6A5UIY1_9PLEO|nr:hypothetical protein CC80DRAFT_434159 [Byssothecium circinans]